MSPLVATGVGAYAHYGYVTANTTGAGPTNTATDTSFLGGVVTVQGGLATATMVFRVKLEGRISNRAMTPGDTLTIKCKVAGTTVFTFTITAPIATALTNKFFELEFVMRVNNPGSSASSRSTAKLLENTSAASAASYGVDASGTASWDSTADWTFDVTAQWSAAATSNSAVAMMAVVTREGV
jgi:hypothetical protein